MLHVPIKTCVTYFQIKQSQWQIPVLILFAVHPITWLHDSCLQSQIDWQPAPYVG